MGWLNVEKPPEKWSAAYFKMFVERVRTALNFLDTSNFPDGISGLWLRDRTLPIHTKCTGYGGLVIPHDFFATAAATSVTATASTAYGSPVLWTPQWTKFGTPYLEVTCYVANATRVGTMEVYSTDGLVGTIACDSTAITRLELPLTALPTVDSTLTFKAKANHASYPLYIFSARIIIKLAELSI